MHYSCSKVGILWRSSFKPNVLASTMKPHFEPGGDMDINLIRHGKLIPAATINISIPYANHSGLACNSIFLSWLLQPRRNRDANDNMHFGWCWYLIQMCHCCSRCKNTMEAYCFTRRILMRSYFVVGWAWLSLRLTWSCWSWHFDQELSYISQSLHLKPLSRIQNSSMK